MAKPLVSVLTPVYNGEEFLAACIESVLRQTHSNWEFVIVDNCSDDGTEAIARRYTDADPRISYERHDEFVNQIHNHNRAFEAMSSESTYCKVVQADDWIYPECLERMVGVAEQHPSVGIVGAYRSKGNAVDLLGVPSGRSVVPGVEILRQSLLGGPYVTGTPTSTLLRSELVRARQPFYDPSFRHADTEAAYRLFSVGDFGMVHEVLTFTRMRPVSETSFSMRVNSYGPENLRMLIRYGPQVLSWTEYRSRLQTELRRYVGWQAKQRLKPSRLRDAEFRDYHRRVIDEIEADAAGDREVRRAMTVIRWLLGQPGARAWPPRQVAAPSRSTSRRSAQS
jgi:glycosyltransferase involved in cell wall biosynthesis